MIVTGEHLSLFFYGSYCGVYVHSFSLSCFAVFGSFVDVCGFLRNPQVDLQAQDRAHRIGQKKEVQVFRFCTEVWICVF